MTQIISIAAADAVLQVSDRRYVWLGRDGMPTRRDDEANKAVWFGGRLVLAFTGLAQVGPRRQNTDEWIADVLNPARGQPEALQRLEDAATARFAHPLIARLPAEFRCHEFVGVGYATFDGGDVEPYISVVSNSRSAGGELTAAQPRFTTGVVRTTQASPIVAATAGQPLGADAQAILQKGLDGYLRGALTVLGLAEAAVDAVHKTAAQNPLVGAGVMVNCLPRTAVEDPNPLGVMLASGPMSDVPTFLSVRPGATIGELVGPIFVSGHNGAIIREFSARPLTDGEREG